MGNFYANITTYGPDREDVLRVLREKKRHALVAPTVNRRTIIFDREVDSMDEDEFRNAGQVLSQGLSCSALTVVIADETEMAMLLHRDGQELVDFWTSGSRRGAYQLCRAFNRVVLTPWMWLLLQFPLLFQTIRHGLIARALGIPAWCVAAGYRYLMEDEYPAGLSPDDLEST